MLHHGTIRKYTAALLDLFNGLEIQYADSAGNVISRNVPVKYTSREKSKIFDEYTQKQLLEGNYNVLPRANLSMSTCVKADQRISNKNLKVNTVKNEETFEYAYNSVPYEFTFEFAVICRGMNEASMIIEQVAPKFNPTINIDIWDAQNLSAPTRVPVRLLDIGIENEDYEELSTNLVTVSFGISLMGNLYQPIRSVDRVKEFKMLLNEQNGDYFTRKTILGWDVADDGSLTNPTETRIQMDETYAPTIIDIIGSNVTVGQNSIYVIYNDKDSKLTELSFVWDVLAGNANVQGDLDKAELLVNAPGDIEVQVTITDPYGNYTSLSKTFTV